MGTRPPNNNAIRVPLRETAVAALLVDVRPSIQPVPDGDSPRSRNRFDKVGHRLATCHWMGRGRSQGQTGSTPCHQMHRETVCRSRRLYLRRAFSRSNLALSRTPLDLPLTSPPRRWGQRTTFNCVSFQGASFAAVRLSENTRFESSGCPETRPPVPPWDS